jgi:hypothetical protein
MHVIYYKYVDLQMLSNFANLNHTCKPSLT